MENEEMQLTEAARGFLRESARWSKFLAIVGFIFIGLIVILAIFVGAIFSSLPDTGNFPLGAMKGFLTAIYLIMAVIYFFPVYYLYKYANDTKEAIDSNDNELLAKGLESLKSHHKFFGIMTIVALSFYALGILFSIIAGIAS